MGGAQLVRVATTAEILGGLQRSDGQRGSQHGHVDMCTLAGGAGLWQSGTDGKSGIQTGCKVRQWNTAFDGGSTCFARHAHHAAHGLNRQVKAAFLRARAALSIGGN